LVSVAHQMAIEPMVTITSGMLFVEHPWCAMGSEKWCATGTEK
jgi:hypothetical protein